MTANNNASFSPVLPGPFSVKRSFLAAIPGVLVATWALGSFLVAGVRIAIEGDVIAGLVTIAMPLLAVTAGIWYHVTKVNRRAIEWDGKEVTFYSGTGDCLRIAPARARLVISNTYVGLRPEEGGETLVNFSYLRRSDRNRVIERLRELGFAEVIEGGHK